MSRTVKEKLNWEKFWSWLLMLARGESVYWDDATLAEWLEIKRREYEKAKRERNELIGLIKWISKRLDEVPVTTLNGSVVWVIDSASYNALANNILTRIDDYLEES